MTTRWPGGTWPTPTRTGSPRRAGGARARPPSAPGEPMLAHQSDAHLDFFGL
ncbi:hypothetical protein [Micromonospora chersina]|uniref:hypothetical protein n=1 Tax=Micromonospora chersina TaxID=47854 RepID=UPI0037188253